MQKVVAENIQAEEMIIYQGFDITGTGRDEHGDTGDDDCAFSEVNERFGFNRNRNVLTIDEDGEPSLNGIVNLTEEVLELREQRGMRQYHSMPEIMTGTITTGLEVKLMGTLRPQDREVFIRSESAIGDVKEEMRVNTGEDSGLSGDGEAFGEEVAGNEYNRSRHNDAGRVSEEGTVGLAEEGSHQDRSA